MAVEYNIPENVISLISGRLLWNYDTFMFELEKDADQAFRKTLDEGGIDYDDDLIKTLVDEYKANRNDLQSLSKGYYQEKKPTVI